MSRLRLKCTKIASRRLSVCVFDGFDTHLNLSDVHETGPLTNFTARARAKFCAVFREHPVCSSEVNTCSARVERRRNGEKQVRAPTQYLRRLGS